MEFFDSHLTPRPGERVGHATIEDFRLSEVVQDFELKCLLAWP
jgi:hypothetical protein